MNTCARWRTFVRVPPATVMIFLRAEGGEVRLDQVNDAPLQRNVSSTFHYGNDVPNFPEVSGTSFPVLTTVLAGFAVTISVQIILRPEGASDLPWRVSLGLGAFLLSTLALLLATTFAVNAQARNYLPFLDLDDLGKQLLDVDDINGWILGVERQWYVYHWAALIAFYSGVALLLAGLNLIIWVYAGGWLAGMFLAAILLSLCATFGVAMFVERVAGPARSS